jgi:hypothetical protein
MPVMPDPLPFELHSVPRGPRWIAWVTVPGQTQPWRSVVVVGATREEAEDHARSWAEQQRAAWPAATDATSDTPARDFAE